MKTKNRFTQVAILDVCTSDYFSGYSYPTLQVSTYYGQTSHDLANEIKQAVNFDYDYLIGGYTEKEIKLFDDYANKLLKEDSIILGYISEDIMNDITSEDFTEDCFIFLGLCKPVQRYGLNFLNN